MKLQTKIYNLSKFLAVFLVGIMVWYFTTGSGDYHRYLVYDDSIALNDSMVSEWTPLNGSSNVALFFSVGDTTWARLEIEYRYGQETLIKTVADTMSLDTRGGTLTGKSIGKVYQGYGLATSLIPGANAIRVRTIMASATSASSWIHVGMTYGD